MADGTQTPTPTETSAPTETTDERRARIAALLAELESMGPVDPTGPDAEEVRSLEERMTDIEKDLERILAHITGK